MLTRIFWIDAPVAGRLAIMKRPLGERLAEDVAAWQAAGIATVVSLLEPDEAGELGLGREAEFCQAAAIEFLSFPIPDYAVPASAAATLALAASIAGRLRGGRAVAIHCRAGIGRSSVVASCVLAQLGWAAEEAMTAIGAARGVRVPDTDEQRRWVLRHAVMQRSQLSG